MNLLASELTLNEKYTNIALIHTTYTGKLVLDNYQTNYEVN